MRVPIVAGNWKMNLTRSEATQLCAALVAAQVPSASVEVVVCPPSCYLDCVVAATQGSSVRVGAQNAYHEAKGAFTGEISPGMVKDLGATYVILGHSERRVLFGETDALINRKVHAVLGQKLTPIICVGELLEQREKGETAGVIRQQFVGASQGLNAEQMQQVVIAYEPVWAIGTGKVATPAQAEEVHAQLRQLLTDHFGAATADLVRIQYGGSVNAENAAELLRQPNIDGALVGGASLKADSFMTIVNAARAAQA